jgi:hypothetical protein
MKTLIILLLISSYSFGQNNDSVRVEIKKPKKQKGITYYRIFDLDRKVNYFMVCKPPYEIGKIVMISKNDLLTTKK